MANVPQTMITSRHSPNTLQAPNTSVTDSTVNNSSGMDHSLLGSIKYYHILSVCVCLLIRVTYPMTLWQFIRAPLATHSKFHILLLLLFLSCVSSMLGPSLEGYNYCCHGCSKFLNSTTSRQNSFSPFFYYFSCVCIMLGASQEDYNC